MCYAGTKLHKIHEIRLNRTMKTYPEPQVFINRKKHFEPHLVDYY